MSEVDFKKFIQSTKVNKLIIKQKKVSKFQTLHSTKKNNLKNENRNKFSENKFLQTYVDTTVERKNIIIRGADSNKNGNEKVY